MPRLSLHSDTLLRSLGFSVYVLWLTALPMSGPLQGNGGTLSWFLWPHLFALLLCARSSAAVFRRLVLAGTLLCALVTLLWLPLAGRLVDGWLLLLGLAAAPLSYSRLVSALF